MSEDEKKISIALPGEWAIRQVLGPTLAEVGEDLRKIYARGRDNIFSAARGKIQNPDDGKRANLRVTRDVLWNGAYSDNEICAEYFGGILAASRSDDGQDDEAIQFVDVIKSMSSKQLRLHYVIYNALNKLFVRSDRSVNVGLGSEIQSRRVWFASHELVVRLGLQVETDPNILHRLGLLCEYKVNTHIQVKQALPYFSASPTTFGILLYAAAHNRLNEWRSFNCVDFGDFNNVVMPNYFAATKGKLASAVGLGRKEEHRTGDT